MDNKKQLKNQKHDSTAKIAIWYTIGNIFAKGMAFITTPIFTRLLSNGQYGEFSNFTSWVNIILVLATFDLTASITRAKYDYDETMDQYLSSITLFSNIITLLFYGVVECFSDYFCSLLAMDLVYIRLMFLFVLLWPAFSYLQVKHRIYRKYKFFVAFSISSVFLSTLFSVLLVFLMKDKLLGRTIGYVVPVAVMYFFLWCYIVKKGKCFSWKCIRYACAISIPLIPHTLSGILLGNSARIMITQICGAEANAMYSLAYQISLFASLLWTSMNQAWAPWLYDQIHAKKDEDIRKYSKMYLGIFSVLVIGILLVTPELVLILGGEDYSAAQYIIPPIILGCCFQFIYGMYVNIEIYEKKTFITSVGSVMAALFNIGLNAVFIPKFGYLAAGYTTLAGYMALFLFHYLIVTVKLKHLSHIYEKRFVFTVILGLTLSSFISLLLLPYNAIRYSLIAIYSILGICVVIKYRQLILDILRR